LISSILFRTIYSTKHAKRMGWDVVRVVKDEGRLPEEIVEAEIVEPEAEPANDTPPRVAEMIKAGAFDVNRGTDQ
jgi:hypothetical protein